MLLRAGFEPATYGFLLSSNYSPPLYQLSYRRELPPNHYQLQSDLAVLHISSLKGISCPSEASHISVGLRFLKNPDIQRVRMAEWSKALRSGRSPLLWAWVRIPLLTT